MAGNSTVDTVKYLPCLYHYAEVLLFGISAFCIGVIVGFLLGQAIGI